MSLRHHIIELRAAFNVYTTILNSLLERVIEFENDPIRSFANAFAEDHRTYSSSDYESSSGGNSPSRRNSPVMFPSPPMLIRQPVARIPIIDLEDEPDERTYRRLDIEQFGV
jgi:hypothetical protein